MRNNRTQAITLFRKTVYAYYRKNKRILPFRWIDDPYQVIVSEIMLQQTQVPRVIEKFSLFIKAFPTMQTLASAPLAKVLAVWQGLGYNRRALLLQNLAQKVVNEYGGVIPSDPEILCQLPGIGKATAGSIAAFAFNKPVVFIETNIRSVFIHHFFQDRLDIGDDELYPLVSAALDRKNPREWYYALMDYGVYLKQHLANPSRRSRHYSKQSAFNGSDRQIRGAIIRVLLRKKKLAVSAVFDAVGCPYDRGEKILSSLCADALVVRMGGSVRLA